MLGPAGTGGRRLCAFERRRAAVGALVLGYYDHGKLVYAGRTGTGFTHATARELYRKLKALRTEKSPFATVPEEERGARKPVWVEPKLVAEVDFHGWTHGDRVRQASFQGLREDKAAKEVVRETNGCRCAPAGRPRSSAARRGKEAGRQRCWHRAHPSRPRLLGGCRRHQARPRRLLQSDLDMDAPACRRPADRAAALPGRRRRPVLLPEARQRRHFHRAPASGGGERRQDHLHRRSRRADRAGAGAACWKCTPAARPSTISTRPTGWCSTSIPAPAPAGARWWPPRATCASGSKASSSRPSSRPPAARACTSCCRSGRRRGRQPRISATRWPKRWRRTRRSRYVATATKSKRNKRIFIDYLRNSREATAVAPYSTRARPGAPVSVPIDWSELGALKSANQYTVLNLPTRLARLRKDPWADIGRLKQALPKFK